MDKPHFVVVTASKSILVSSASNKIARIMKKGMICKYINFLFPLLLFSLSSPILSFFHLLSYLLSLSSLLSLFSSPYVFNFLYYLFICLFVYLFIHSFIHSFKLESGEYAAIVVAGDGNWQSKDGTATECSFNSPFGIAVDEKTHTCFVADWMSSRLRKITFVD
jgi:hypothetical protein